MIVYRIENTNFEGQLVTLHITDTSTTGDVVYTDLNGVEISRRTIDNNEDKFTVIRALELTVKFLSTSTVNVNTFAAGDDDRYKVECLIGSTNYFTGFLAMDDLREPYFEPPNVVVLTATDNLGILKEEPLVDLSGNNPEGYNWLATWIALCLGRTGLELPIYISWNLVELDETLPIWNNINLQAKTFESEIGESINCYEALEKILRNSCYIQQRNGAWWVQSVDEMEDTANTYYKLFSLLGGIETPNISVNNLVPIGQTETIRFINENQEVGPQRKKKEAKLIYHYETPIEVIDNINLERGTLFNTIGLEKRYTIDHWTTKRNFPASGTPVTVPYIRRLFDANAYEIERDVVLPASASGGNFEYIESKPIPLTLQDKFNISFDHRFESNKTGSGYITHLIACIYIKSGATIYSLKNDRTWVSGYDYVSYQWQRTVEDESKWMSVSIEAQPVPITGELFVCLMKSSIYGLTDNTHFANLNFEYIPYLNGIYHRLNGHYNKMTKAGNNKARLEEEVYINNSPKPLFKGAMFRWTGSAYALINGVANVWRYPVPLYRETFGKDQAISVWNQHNREMVKLEGSLQGLNSATQIPDCVDKFQFTDSNINVDNKVFMCVGFEQDLFSCEWKGTFIEVYDTDLGKTGAIETHEFKHIEG